MRKARHKENGAEALDLLTSYPRRQVKIDGESYEMVHPGEISLAQTRRLEFQRKRLAVLMASEDEPRPEQEEEIAASFAVILQTMIPELPLDVIKKLPDREKIRAVDFFRRAAPIEPETEPTTTRPDGESSVSASNGSTEPPTHSAGAG